MGDGELPAPREAEMWRLVEQVIRHAIEETYRSCVQRSDLPAAARLLGWARQAALLGIETDAFDKFVRCARFEVDFDSTITTKGSRTGTQSSATHDGSFRVVANDVLIEFGTIPEGPLTHSGSAFTSTVSYPGECNLESHTVFARADPGKLTPIVVLDINPFETPPGAQPPPRRHKLRLSVSRYPVEHYRTYNTGCTAGDTGTHTNWRWHDIFASFRGQSSVAEMVLDADMQQGTLVGAKTFSHKRVTSSTTDEETTFVELWHKPLP